MTIKEYFNSQKWTFAKTYAAFAPHEYIIKREVSDKEMFDNAVDYINENGMRMFYYDKEQMYLFVDGWFYWGWRDKEHPETQHGIINRCKPEDYDIMWFKKGTHVKRMAEKQKEQEEKLERKHKREEQKRIKYEQAELKFE